MRLWLATFWRLLSLANSLIDPTHKILFHLDRLQSFLRDETVYPISVEMDLSDYCNLKCSWCRFAYAHKPNVMPLWLAEKILRELHEVDVKSVVYSGGGEPLLNANFNKIAELGYSLGLDQGIYTNGLNIDKFVETLNWTMKFIYISLDAATRETYLKTKGVDCFNKVLRNVQLLCEHKDKAKIGLGFLISPDNFTEAQSFRYFLEKFDVDYIQFRPAVIKNIDKEWLQAVIEMLKPIDGDGCIVAWYKFYDLLREDAGRTYTKCLGHNFLGGISADGTVWICLNYRYREGYDIGNLKGQTFREIWGGQRRQEVMQKINLAECPKLCRPHELNKFLDHATKDNPHKNFL
jgi:MoaA/NifB/PqqE/SkfB family radical SAM enzyme